jgi:hypothetical protein
MGLGHHGKTQTRLLALLACGWLITAPSARADEHAVNAQALGVTESVLQYCGALDPAAAARLREKIKQIIGGASNQQLAKVRGSDEYRRAYDSVVDFIGKVDEHNARRVCSESPGAGQ